MNPTNEANAPHLETSAKDLLTVRFVSYHKQMVDGLEFNVPKTDEGELLLWRCLPDCGRSCFPSALSLLPRQVEGMKARGAKVLELDPPNLPQLEDRATGGGALGSPKT